MLTPLVAGLCGAMFFTSYDNADGTQWRSQRYTDLASLVQDQNDEVSLLNARTKALTEEIDALTARVGDERVQQSRVRERRLRPDAGLSEVDGPGVTVTLSDAPEDVINSAEAGTNLNLLVVHQQDIQRVVNAMWAGGAEAITIQGQRIITTTGIKCEGNAIQLHGIAYPQPYVIQAVGNQADVLTALEQDSYLQTYRDQALDPAYQIGWRLDTQTEASAPAYDGSVGAAYARPLD